MRLRGLKDKKVTRWLSHDNIIRRWSDLTCHCERPTGALQSSLDCFTSFAMTNTNAPQITIQPLNFSTIQPRKRCAFTLAEVLITLAVVGIIAALVVPNVVAKVEKHKTTVVLKKAYSDLGNYLKMFDYDKNCNGNSLLCVPENQQIPSSFSIEFASYLLEKHKFSHIIPQNVLQYLCKDDGARYSAISVTRDTHMLISPTGTYAYLIIGFPHDNYYYPSTSQSSHELYGTLRAMIFIITNPKYINPGVDCSPNNKKSLQMGRNTFEVYITSKERIIPQGFPECVNCGYYCDAISAEELTSKENPGAASMYRIIKNGFKIDYDL